ncbi:hypothetical protein ACFLQV_04415 [Calditrichota bacterium]
MLKRLMIIGVVELAKGTASWLAIDWWRGKFNPNRQAVYISKRGISYHLKSCSNVRGETFIVTKGYAIKRGLKPCSVCQPGS